ncbi:MAG: hypothetical protein KatS3mg091_334 [Patescibacteria group bacterium]|nr:MAG: hypothetical protein KatS3mg091_334 [Patescibacteria group bacterium]
MKPCLIAKRLIGRNRLRILLFVLTSPKRLLVFFAIILFLLSYIKTLVVLVLLILCLVVFGWVLYNKGIFSVFNTSKEEQLLSKLKKQIFIDEADLPTIATVTDESKLRNQEFLGEQKTVILSLSLLSQKGQFCIDLR